MHETTAIKLLAAGDEHALDTVASGVFDREIDPDATHDFLADRRHHLAVALDRGTVVGFASAVHYLHPDKPHPELWINEIGVAPTHRRYGIGRQLLDALLAHGRALGCIEGWVLTERDNEAAQNLYESLGGVQPSHAPVMFAFHLGESVTS
jgi:aminoglycoside 6'-N-acetyltransferase I